MTKEQKLHTTIAILKEYLRENALSDDPIITAYCIDCEMLIKDHLDELKRVYGSAATINYDPIPEDFEEDDISFEEFE